MISIEQDNILQLNRFNKNPPHPSYISGFIDGDGCIFIRKTKDGYVSGIHIAQSRTNILQIIRYHFGGSITTTSSRNSKIIDDLDNDENISKYNKRNQFNLNILNNEYNILLNYLKNHLIVKEEQFQSLCEFSKYVNLQNNEEKKQLYLRCSELNKQKCLNEIYLSRLNNEYISGIFDAEGCVYIQKDLKKVRLSISQKNHPLLLIAIIKYLNYGKISGYNFVIYKKEDCLKFIELVKEHIIVKYNQIIAFEKFLNTTDINTKTEIYKICNQEKHTTEIFTNLNKNNIGKDRYLEQMKYIDFKKIAMKELERKQVYKEKSEKMTGEGNHNYGKSFSEETKKKMSDSIRDAKGGVSDETILNVRKLIEEGYTNVQIQELLNLPRHTVSRIKNNNIVCRDEAKVIKKSVTQEQLNISKRKITVHEIFTVVDKFTKKISPKEILEILVKEREKNNIQRQTIAKSSQNMTPQKVNQNELELTKIQSAAETV
jgi:hypothetical protein